MRPVLKRLLLALLTLFGILSLFILFLWMKAGWDFPYLVRVLWHQDSSTDDYTWKRSMRVAPAPSPSALPSVDDCAAVARAFAADPETPDLDAYLRRGGALSFVVVRDGTMVCEWYGNGGAREQPAAAFSISKTVTSLLLARAVADGKLASLDDAITTHVPQLRSRDPRFAAITLASLVDMRSGIAFDEDASFPWVDQDAPAVYYASDLARTVIARPHIASPPGTFLYNDYAPNLLGLALEHAYGGTRLAPGPMQQLWTDLGAEYPALWSVDDRGFAWHESGLVVTARDLARIGQLMLTDGKVADRQVAPTAFLARSLDPAGRARVTTFAGTDVGYRNGWWTVDDALVAMGKHGQVMIVSPSTRTVIVRLGKDGHAETNISIARRLLAVARKMRGPAP